MPAQLPPGFQIDPALSAQYGSPVAVNAEGKKIRWNEGGAPAGATLRPEYGQGVYQTPDGAIVKPGKSGALQVINGPQTVGADSRPRMEMGLGPAIEAQRNMYDEERGFDPKKGTQNVGGAIDNPNDSFQGVVYNLLADGQREHPIRNMVGKSIGGPRVAKYNQAAATYEAAVLPILSGAAITNTEAPRQVKASLPEPGDSPEILARKSKVRAMQLNGIAKMLGEPLPFPRLGIISLAGQAQGQPAPARAAPRPAPAKASSFKYLGPE